MTNTMQRRRPMMEITWAVLESAKDAGIDDVVAACRRAIVADRLGRRIGKADTATIREAYEAIAETQGAIS